MKREHESEEEEETAADAADGRETRAKESEHNGRRPPPPNTNGGDGPTSRRLFEWQLVRPPPTCRGPVAAVTGRPYHPQRRPAPTRLSLTLPLGLPETCQRGRARPSQCCLLISDPAA